MSRTPFDFFAAGALPVPTLSAADAERVAAGLGVAASARDLGSQQDQNFLLTRDGRPVGVLKIANPVFSLDEVRAQDAAASAIASATGLRAAEAITPAIELPDGAIARVIRHLDGGTFEGDGHLSPAVVAAMGRVAGEVSAALEGLDTTGLDRVLQWDPRHGDRVVAALATHHPDPERIVRAATDAWAALQRVSAELPVQPVHLDLTDDNLVRGADGLPDGVIDFGDVVRSWRVAELATTVSALLHHAGLEPFAVLPAVRAFHELRPLEPAEVQALWPLVVLRGAVLVLSSAQQLAIDDANGYAAERAEGERAVFEQAVSVPSPVMTALIADALGMPLPALALPSHRLVADLRAPSSPFPASEGSDVEPRRLELDVESDGVDDGAWLETGLADRLAMAAVAAGDPAVATRYGAVRLDGAATLSRTSGATVATGIEFWTADAVPLHAPWDGTLAVGPDGIRLHGAEAVLVLRGVDALGAAGVAVAAGEPIARSRPARTPRASALHREGSPMHRPTASAPATSDPSAGETATGAWAAVHAPGIEVPSRVRPEYARGWLALTADPGPLLGLEPEASVPRDDSIERRARSFADVQEHYYEAPPRIERGWRHHLIDVDGRVYLDMINNVTSIGHAHPALTDAVSRQLRRLNTNSRFHYRGVAEYSERLAALLPDPLDTVLLVNSGSEATDLAIRIATVASGHRDVLALAEAYHGWTYGSDAVSTSLNDNPHALGTRPDWVHTLDAPRAYRGRYPAAEAHRYAADAAARVDALVAAGRPPAAFIAETLFGNAGAIPLPDGYLAHVYAAVRAAGGYAIADEVQVGFGRLGRWFWGFEQQGVVPDIVAVAKSLGSGYPLGAVITTRAIAERFAADGPFFSSTGGSPAACAAGLAVLDVIRDERLQANALEVGERLRQGLDGLAARHPAIGAVHGAGLYLGVEIVDPASGEPDRDAARRICERLLGAGVIEQPTGDHKNVLKVKPPLCIDAAAVDFYVDALDRVLAEGF